MKNNRPDCNPTAITYSDIYIPYINLEHDTFLPLPLIFVPETTSKNNTRIYIGYRSG